MMLLGLFSLLLLLACLILVYVLIRTSHLSNALMKQHNLTLLASQQSLVNQLRSQELMTLQQLQVATLPQDSLNSQGQQDQRLTSNPDEWISEAAEYAMSLEEQGLTLGDAGNDLSAAGWPTVVRGRDGATYSGE